MMKQCFSFYRAGQIRMGPYLMARNRGRRIGVDRDGDQRHGGTDAPLLPHQINPAEAGMLTSVIGQSK